MRVLCPTWLTAAVPVHVWIAERAKERVGDESRARQTAQRRVRRAPRRRSLFSPPGACAAKLTGSLDAPTRTPPAAAPPCPPLARASARPHPHCPPTTRTRILRSPPRPPTRSPASHSAPSPTCWSRAHGTTRSGAGTCSRRARRYPRRRPTTTSRCCARRGARTGAPSFQVREEGGESVFVMGGAFCRACCALRLLPFCRRETASVCAYMWACLTGAAVR